MTEPLTHEMTGHGRNPFSNVPEVRLGGNTRPVVSIETKAVRQVRDATLEYLGARGSDSSRPEGTGRVLVVVGDYGSGKSHLAAEVIHCVSDSSERAVVLTLYAEVGDTALDLYRRVFQRDGATRSRTLGGSDATGGALLLNDVVACVEECRKAIRRQLDRCDNLDIESPDTWSSPPSPRGTGDFDIELITGLHEQLATITGDTELAHGLVLLLHSDQRISGSAWDWFRGGQPTRELADRGVSQPIADDARALAAARALAMLFGHCGQQFILVIDELQNLRGGADDSPNALAMVVNPLLAWAAATGAFLVLCGLSDFWRALPESVHQRAGKVVRPTPLSVDNIAEYIQEAQLMVNGKRQLEPFTKTSVKYLRDITSGHPRKTIALCHHAYRMVQGADTIKAVHLREASRELSGPDTAEDVIAEIIALCAQLGLPAVRKSPPAEGGGMTDHVWVSARGHDQGCAVVVTDPVLDDTDARSLVEAARRLRGTSQQSRHPIIAVVIGLMAGVVVKDIRRAYDHVFIWDRDHFARDLTAIIDGLSSEEAEHDPAAGSQLLAQLYARLNQIAGQRESDHELLGKLADAQDEHRLRRIVREETRRSYLLESESEELMQFPLDPLNELFDDRLRLIRDTIHRADRRWRSVFASGELINRIDAPGGRPMLIEDMAAEEVIRTLGVLAALEKALQGFGWGLIGLLNSDGEHGKDTRRELRGQCDRFNNVVDLLIRHVPATENDLYRATNRILETDKKIIRQHLSRFGSVVFDTIYEEDLRRL